jgi:hypothetical protein
MLNQFYFRRQQVDLLRVEEEINGEVKTEKQVLNNLKSLCFQTLLARETLA